MKFTYFPDPHFFPSPSTHLIISPLPSCLLNYRQLTILSVSYDVNLDLVDSMSGEELANLLPSAIQRQVLAIPSSVLDMSFEALEKKIPEHLRIDASRARIAFWLEFERHHRTGQQFSLSAVYSGLMPYKRFQRDICSNSYVLAYLITPPPVYNVVMEEMLHYGISLQREILGLPHYTKDKDGDHILDLPLLKLKNTIIDGIHDRIKGLPVSKNLHISKSLDGGEETTEKKRSLTDIERRIQELEGQSSAIDVKVNK